MNENITLGKKLDKVAVVVSVVVLALVVLMRRPEKLDLGMDLRFLPPVHALLNTLTALLLMASYYAIRQKNVALHQRLNYAALGASALFLVCYVLYHATTPEVKFGDANHDGLLAPEEIAAVSSERGKYLILLLTHIALAALSFPFILLTFIRGYTHQIEKHRRMAKWVYPIWLYVAITGPICYWWLKSYY